MAWPVVFVTTWPMNFAEELPETSMQRVDVGVLSDLFGMCSGSFRDLELEAEAVHEITAVFQLLFLLGRAR